MKNILICLLAAMAVILIVKTAFAEEIYIVKKGDCLSWIAKNHNLTVAQIATVNNIKNVDFIYPGQKLQISAQTATAKDSSQKSKMSQIVSDAKKRNIQIDNSVFYNGKEYKISPMPPKEERLQIISEAAMTYDVDKYIVYGMVMVESRNGERCVSNPFSPCIGPAQIYVKLHSDKISLEDALRYKPSIYFMCRLLKEKGWDKDWEKAVRSYNGDPTIKKTKMYLQQVKKYAEQGQLSFGDDNNKIKIVSL